MDWLPTKRELMEHYATKEPTPFAQWDGFDMGDIDDYVMQSDKDGHCIMGPKLTNELMTTRPTVRVLIPEGESVSAATAATLLHKIADEIQERGQNIGANCQWEMRPYKPNDQLHAEGVVGKRVRFFDAPEREESYGIVTRAVGGMVVVRWPKPAIGFAQPVYSMDKFAVHPDDEDHPAPGQVQLTVTWTENVAF
jgi:hypothetical protein